MGKIIITSEQKNFKKKIEKIEKKIRCSGCWQGPGMNCVMVEEGGSLSCPYFESLVRAQYSTHSFLLSVP